MEIQLAALCDSASDYNGKLCVLGAFDTIFAKSLPAIHPQCAIALRMCFWPEDSEKIKLRISLINADGVDVIPPFEPTIEIAVPPDAFFVTRNLVMNLQRLSFQEEGPFSVDIRVGDEILQRIPLRVLLLEKRS
jgi:hypothetical protein